MSSPVPQIPQRLEIEHQIWRRDIRIIAGVDEVGRGPLAGPVVAAAVIFPPYHFIDGVRDSKKLTPRRREVLFSQIVEECSSYGIGRVEPAEIDRINIRQATFKAMRIAIGQLKPPPQYLLIDGEELPEKLLPQEGLIGGDDRSFLIGAASILAKVTRDRMMLEYHREFPEYGFDRHKGYGTAFHREMVLKFGPCVIHRRSFLKKILHPVNPADNPPRLNQR